MKTRLMRRLDTLVGLPLAWALGLVRIRRRVAPARPRTVAVVKLFGMGSIILAASALERFRTRQPQARIVLVTFANHAEIGALLDGFDEVLAIRNDGIMRFVADTIRTWWGLACARPDLIVDIEYFSKYSSVLCALVPHAYHVGFLLPARWRARLVDGGIAFREDIHFAESVARLLHGWGVDYRDLPPARVTCAASAAVRDEQLIVCNPNAHDMCPERRWPAARFAALADELLGGDAGLRIVLVGTANERAYAEHVRELMKPATRARVRVAAGETTLRELCALLRAARLLVTNDSGVMHLAAALGTPLVALFGPEAPVRYHPLHASGHCRVLSADVVCGPCLSYMNRKVPPCHGRNVCMQQLDVATVARACRELLKG